MSAITHPDMARIVDRHRLVPVPVDLDLDTLEPRPDLLGSALTARSRMLVVAHLFGSRSRLDEAVAFCRRHGLLLVEDCAQALRAPDDLGDERAEASLFSFGSIKTAPALGGAVAYVRDPALLERMRETQRGWPLQRRGTYAGRVVRFAGLLALGHPVVYEGFVRAGRRAGLDVDALVNRSVHALKPPSAEDGDDFFGEWLHRRPSAPLLALLRRRLRTFDRERLRSRADRGERAARALPEGVLQPGRDAPVRTHWVFPVACDEPERLIEALRAQGFDATTATSSIASIAPPAGRTDLEARAASHLMEHVVFVPVYPELPERAFARLLDLLGRPAAYGLPSANSASSSRSRATATPSSRSARSRSSR
jgi:dTDP-4-amino-4,6-dideoxygalactose transaminase